MNKVTEARKKILGILSSLHDLPTNPNFTRLQTRYINQIQEIVLNDEEWNEPKQEAKKDEQDGEGFGLLDTFIDNIDDIPGGD